MPRALGRVSYANNARENIAGKSSQLIRRLYEHANGDLYARPDALRKIIALVRDFEGPDQALVRQLSELLVMVGMDNSQVKAAEILLKKSVPDIAQIEYRGEHTTTHVVALPQGIDADQWTKLVNAGKDPPRLVHES